MFTGPNHFLTPKRAHTKSKRGCQECKTRKVKCDEVRPLCDNCRRRYPNIPDWRCVWDEPPKSSGAVVRPLQPSPPQVSPDETKPEASPASNTPVNAIRQSTIELQETRGAMPPPTPPQLTIAIRGDMLDPFETHPESRVINSDGLMKHYLSSVIYQSFPWQPKSDKNPVIKYYAPSIWQDPVMFHATLQLSAFRMEGRIPRTGQECRFLMAECIRLLNMRIQDPVQRISDQTIGAVATLAAVEYERANMRMFQMHLNGMKKMLDMRGGLSAVRSSSPMVANMVFWSFVIAMTETGVLQLDPDDVLETPPWLFDARITYGDTSHLDLYDYGVDPNVAGIMLDVKHLSQRFVRISDYTTVDECLSALTFVCNILQRVLSIPPKYPPMAWNTLITEACRLAVGLHVMTPWRGLRPDPQLVINRLLHELKTCLGPLLATGTSNELLLWLLFTGGVSALGLPERVWYVGHLATVVTDLNMNDWGAVKSTLVKVIWHELLGERSYKRLWDEVEVHKDSIDYLEL